MSSLTCSSNSVVLVHLFLPLNHGKPNVESVNYYYNCTCQSECEDIEGGSLITY